MEPQLGKSLNPAAASPTASSANQESGCDLTRHHLPSYATGTTGAAFDARSAHSAISQQSTSVSADSKLQENSVSQKIANFGQSAMGLGGVIAMVGLASSFGLMYLHMSASMNPAQIIRESLNSAQASQDSWGAICLITLAAAVPAAIGGTIALCGKAIKEMGHLIGKYF